MMVSVAEVRRFLNHKLTTCNRGTLQGILKDLETIRECQGLDSIEKELYEKVKEELERRDRK